MTAFTRIRWATQSDYNQLGHIMFDAVRNGQSLYNEAQRAAWMPTPRAGIDWENRLAKQSIIIEENSTQINGFMSLLPDGYIDFAYIRPSVQRSGMFRRLYDKIEYQALDTHTDRLWTHASLMARPAFSAMGFIVTNNQNVELNGQTFNRFKMEKILINTQLK